MTGAGTNTWFIDGAEPALVDAGTGEAAHIEAIAAVLRGRPLVRVLVTHGHADHASGVPALHARWPGLEACKRVLGPESGWRAIEGGDRMRAGDTQLRVIVTPGHALDHVCFWHEASRSLFAGDMVLRGTTVMIPAGRGGGLRAYLASLERLLALQPERIYPGHGAVIEDPIAAIQQYIERRRAREQQIAALVSAGVSDVEELVRRIYPGLSEGVRPAARATVEAHLEKLREDG